jgi:hypothetical protein
VLAAAVLSESFAMSRLSAGAVQGCWALVDELFFRGAKDLNVLAQLCAQDDFVTGAPPVST